MSSSKQEWAQMWPLPFVSMFGIAGAPIFTYAAGVFMEPMTVELGWSRTQFFSALTLQMLAALLLVPFVGALIDRVGSRKVALIAIAIFVIAASMLGSASGALWQWWLLSLFYLVCGAGISQPVWVKPIAARFRASRGIAMAVALSGNGVATALWPIAAAFFIAMLGWRAAWPALALCWGLFVLPLALFFFDRRRNEAQVAAKVEVRPLPLSAVIRDKMFFILAFSGALFAAAAYGLTVNLAPIMREDGFDPIAAAGTASLAGIFAIIGRLGAGYLLDRLPTRAVAIAIFSTPILACAALWLANGSLPLFIAAIVLLGLAAGGEIDVITYVVSRKFPPHSFGGVYAAVLSVFGAFAASGPLIASAVFDANGSYDVFLLVAAISLTLGVTLIAQVPPDLRPQEALASNASDPALPFKEASPERDGRL